MDPQATRFLWMCYADAFLMFLVSLKHHVTAAQEDALKNSDLIRMMTMLRNVTVHQAVVSTASPLIMINRIISIGNPQGRREYVVLNTARVTEALDHYEQDLRTTGKWGRERRNVEGARRWNEDQKAAGVTTVSLTEVFREALTVMATTCGFKVPTL